MQNISVQAVGIVLALCAASANAAAPSAQTARGAHSDGTTGLVIPTTASLPRSASASEGQFGPDGSNSYGMLGAGLMIMGVMARRRWRNHN